MKLYLYSGAGMQVARGTQGTPDARPAPEGGRERERMRPRRQDGGEWL